MSTPEDKRKVFPVSIILEFEKELLIKLYEGWMLKKSEKLQLEKLFKRLKA